MPGDQLTTAQVRANLSELLRTGRRIEVMAYTTPYVGLVGAGDLPALQASAGYAVPAAEVRGRWRQLLGDAQRGQVVRVTRFDQPQGAFIPLSLLRQLTAKESPMHEPTVITCWNEAGGAGKTCLAAEIGAILASRTREDGTPLRVLLVDMDPQRSLSHRMGLTGGEANPAERLSASVNTVLQDRDAVLPTPFPAVPLSDLDVIPSHPSLRFLENRLSADGSYLNLRVAIKALRGYAVVIIDTPPSNGDLTRAAIIAADHVVVPVPTNIKGVENFVNVSRVLGECARFNPNTRLLAFVPMSYDKRRDQDRQVLAVLQGPYAELAPCTRPLVERPGVYRNALALRSAIARKYPSTPAAQELREVTDELLALMGTRPELAAV